MRRSLIALSLAGAQLVSCRWAVTEVVVSVDTDAPIDRTLVVTASVFADGADAGVFTVARGGMLMNSVSLPGSFATRPQANAPRDQRVTLLIDAELTSAGPTAPAVRWRRVHRFNFIANQQTELRVFLSTRCGASVSGCARTPAAQCTLSALCEERGLTCGDDAQCVEQNVVPAAMSGDDASVRSDRATMDAPVVGDTGVEAAMDTGACTADTQTDPLNCGACGNRCSGATPVCSAGRCSAGCAAPEQLCSGSCVNLQSNTSHCGACGAMCPTGPNLASTCMAGACQFACAAPFIDCNSNRIDGCEVNPSSDANNCGSCGRRCAGSAVCRSGVCVTPPAGDTCATAVTFNSAMYTGTTCGGDTQLSSCGAPGAPDVFLNWSPPATGSWIISVGAPFSLSTHTGDCRTVHTCYGQTLNGFFVMGSTTTIGVRSNNAAVCGPFTITATM